MIMCVCVCVGLSGIDGPAALLGTEGPDLGSKIQVLSVSQPQQPSPPITEELETDADTETLLEPKTDIHTLLQRRGETHTLDTCLGNIHENVKHTVSL